MTKIGSRHLPKYLKRGSTISVLSKSDASFDQDQAHIVSSHVNYWIPLSYVKTLQMNDAIPISSMATQALASLLLNPMASWLHLRIVVVDGWVE